MLKKAQTEDISRIAEIIVFGKRVAYRHIFNNDIVTFKELQVLNLAENYRSNPLLLNDMIVYDDGIVKGVINRKFVNDSVEICELYVEPFFKGNGIGRELIQYVIAEAKIAHKKKIFLWVIKDNMSARKFYEANGFKENGETCMIEGTEKFDMCYELNIY